MEAAEAFEQLREELKALALDKYKRSELQALLDDVSLAVYDIGMYKPADVISEYRKMYNEEISEECARAISMAATVEASHNGTLKKGMRYYLNRGCILYHENHKAKEVEK